MLYLEREREKEEEKEREKEREISEILKVLKGSCSVVF